MLSLVLFLASVLGFAVFGARRFGWPIAAMPLWTLSFYMSALYVAALSNQLRPACGLLLSAGWGLLIWQLVADRRAWRAWAATVSTPGLVVFLALTIASWLKYHAAAITGWDDFTHWALVIKDMAVTHGLGGADSALHFKDYPPGTALWQYAYVTVAGFSEGAVMVAQSMAVWAVLPVMLAGARWRDGIRIGATLVLYYGAIVALGHDPAALLVDHVLGAWFAAAVAIAWTERAAPGRLAALVLPVLFALGIVKASGFVLALTAGLAAAALVAMAGRPRRWALAAMLVLAPVISFGAWKAHIWHDHISQTFQPQAGAAVESRRAVTATAFGHALVEKPIGAMNVQRRPVVSTAAWLVLLALGVWLARRGRDAADRRRMLAVHGVLAVGAIAYGVGLLWLYVTAFGPYEGPRLASFDRYVATYVLGWLLVLVVQLFESARSGMPGRWAATAALAGLVVLLVRWGPYDAVARLTAPAPGVSALRQTLRAMPIPDEAALGPGPRHCYIVWQHSSGLEYWILRYELVPRLIGQQGLEPFSLGAPYGPDDPWTEPLDPRAWSDMLKAHFEYVLVAHGDAAFDRRYGRLFVQPAGRAIAGLYRVTPGADGWVALRPVAPGAGESLGGGGNQLMKK